MRPLNEIIIHCSATRPDWMVNAKTSAKVAEIRRWHVQDRKWKDIGYHYLIDRDGTVAKGRPLDQIGAHVAGRNTGTIGVCLLGGHGSSEKDKFADNFTPAQERSLRKLLADLINGYPSITRVSGHNQWAAKACPGFNVPSWYARAREYEATVLATSPARTVGDQPLASKPVDDQNTPKVSGGLAAFFAELAKLIAAIFRRFK